ncbi:MAG TPA: hypothetical protein VJ742_08360 [Nitrososphaera sp.]|nr:hypothetical protein [Nitrososphaera sp.]
MSNNFGMFLLFSILVTGLLVNPLAFAQETPVNATETIDPSSNSTSPETIDPSSNSTSPEDETMVVEDELETEDEMAGTEDEVLEAEIMEETVLSPLKQIKEGIVPENVVCKEGLELVFKLNGEPACVKTTSIQKLIAWGWAQ